MSGNSPDIHQLMNSKQTTVYTYNGILLSPEKNEVQACLRDIESWVLDHQNKVNIAIKWVIWISVS